MGHFAGESVTQQPHHCEYKGIDEHDGASLAFGNQRTTARCEVDALNDCATLYFGEREDFVLHLGRDNLRSVAELATQAHAELAAPDA